MDPVGSSRGYGPSMQGRSHLLFDGEESHYEQWEVKLLAFLSLRKLKKTVLGIGVMDYNKNEQAFSEIVQLLDNRSIHLVMREAKDDGKKALEILREHYAGTGTSRIMSLYFVLCTLQKNKNESLIDYVIRAENAAAGLTNAGQEVPDPLLMSMVMKDCLLPTDLL